jgi:uncharacterized protein (DUF433 family)
MSAHLSALEVAALVGLDEARVRKEVEHGLFDRPRFSLADLVYFRTVALLGLQATVEERRRLHELVEKALQKKPVPRTIPLSSITDVKVGAVASEMKDRLDRFVAWKQRLVEDPKILGGEPVFPNSRTAVRHVGGLLLRGVSELEVREDHPHLADGDLAFAKLYAKAYPKMGRPREAAPR